MGENKKLNFEAVKEVKHQAHIFKTAFIVTLESCFDSDVCYF